MIDLQKISVQFSGKYLFQDVDIKINSGDKIALVGSNGAGKSTLLKLIKGDVSPEAGNIQKQNNIKIGCLPQENIIHQGNKLFDEVKNSLANIVALHSDETRIISELKSETLNDERKEFLIWRLGEIHHSLERLDAYGVDSIVKKTLIGLGFKETDFDKETDTFSGGWQMRIAMAKIFLQDSDLLMLDEPTNHLDIESLEWIIEYLKQYNGALIIVSHDKYFVNSVTNKTLEIFNSKLSFFSGKYDSYLNWKAERDKRIEQLYENQQKKIKETEDFIERFRYKATKARQVQNRIKRLEKLEVFELPKLESEIKIKFPEPPKSGVVPIELKNIRKSFGNITVLDKLDLLINRGDKIAFLGPNGTGKTTLAKIIAGKVGLDSGERIIGHNVHISYYSQDTAESLSPDLEVIETVSILGEDKSIAQLRALLGCFLFIGDDVFKKVKVLSGGEKSRLALVCILLTKANLIILDEPTNHLDIASKEALKSALVSYNGTLVIISHDIDFLDSVVNKSLEIRDQTIKLYYGGIDYYLQKKNEEKKMSLEYTRLSENAAKKQPDRKEIKRLEAEIRNKRRLATKELISKIDKLEKLIEKCENEKRDLEIMLSEPEKIKPMTRYRELNIEYKKISDNLNKLISEWSELSDKLEKINSRFNLQLEKLRNDY